MFVYLVTNNVHDVLGIFSTREVAEAYVEEFYDTPLAIETHEIDSKLEEILI